MTCEQTHKLMKLYVHAYFYSYTEDIYIYYKIVYNCFCQQDLYIISTFTYFYLSALNSKIKDANARLFELTQQ